MLTLTTACAGNVPPPQSADPSPIASTPTIPPQEDLLDMDAEQTQLVLQKASDFLQVPVADLTILQSSPQSWPDGCLGLATEDEFCTLAIVPGWEVVVSNNEEQWTFRTDDFIDQIRLDPS